MSYEQEQEPWSGNFKCKNVLVKLIAQNYYKSVMYITMTFPWTFPCSWHSLYTGSSQEPSVLIRYLLCTSHVSAKFSAFLYSKTLIITGTIYHLYMTIWKRPSTSQDNWTDIWGASSVRSRVCAMFWCDAWVGQRTQIRSCRAGLLRQVKLTSVETVWYHLQITSP